MLLFVQLFACGLLIIETQDGFLHVLDKETMKVTTLLNINHIINEDSNQHTGLTYFTPNSSLNLTEYNNKHSKEENLNLEFENTKNILLKEDQEKVLPSHKKFIDSLFLDSNGYFFYKENGKLVSMNLSIVEIIESPKIVRNTVLVSDKNVTIHKIFINNIEIHVFIVNVTITAIDALSYYNRKIFFSYIYYPFTSVCEDLIFQRNSVFLKTKFQTVEFNSNIVGAYMIKKHYNNYYFSKIFTVSKMALPYIKSNRRSKLVYLLSFVVIVLTIIIFRSKRNVVNIKEIIADRKNYVVRKGFFDKTVVIVKVYKKGDIRSENEVNILRKNQSLNIVGYFYQEKRRWSTLIVTEYCKSLYDCNNFNCLRRLSCDILNGIMFLHSKNISHLNLSYQSVCIRNDGCGILTDFEDARYLDSNLSFLEHEIGSKNFRSNEIILFNHKIQNLNSQMAFKADIFGLGIILYFLITRRHPFDLNVNGIPLENMYFSDDEKSDSPSNETTGDQKNNKSLPNKKPDSPPYEDKVSNKKHKSKNKNLEKVESKNSTNEIKKINPIETSLCKNIIKDTENDFEMNILNDKYKLVYLNDHNLHDLVCHCLKLHYMDRPDIFNVGCHPYFWDNEKKFNFLANLSDILENKTEESKRVFLRLERNKRKVFNKSWILYLDKRIEEELNIFRNYNFSTLKGLLRAIRNKGRHYKELPSEIKQLYISFPEGYVDYYVKRFPSLLMTCYYSAKCISTEELLKDFYCKF
ncbi:serine/threonine-protein kinase/endoribonuclease [Hamiltosporidium tvaerminnensis]|uniref:Serine/threonine-protein kinase/endoribonuclease n=1 Tax=Hamiltosporidium tvaerminnensis TaxID=1176355 RepID=A0A4Q9L9L3_9MICR|nr:Serine/threonine-protein kinase/endoribonuclease IRE1 [Hamiltosporidium tvaerminnensis]TBU04354.1 serine/threonine-protein kinase/endoribonuclease [Hamiltosporidium tvaerminnensis]